MCSDFYQNDQICRALGCLFNRRQQKPRVIIPKQKPIGPRSKSLVFADQNDPYGNKVSPTSPDHVGNWAHCKAGDKAPLGALQAPDKFSSLICVWPEKDFCLGRGCDGPHTAGLYAWFPFRGWEYSAVDYNIRFNVLVDDGKNPGLYSWMKVCRLTEQDTYKPVLVHGMSPMVVNNVLGKGSTEYLTAWTCEAGTEKVHNKDEVLRALVLCVRHVSDQPERGWREIHIHEPARVTEHMVHNEVVASCTSIGYNVEEKSKALKATLKYTFEEGQQWKPHEAEECDLLTIVKSENVLRKLAEGKLPIGLALYGTDRQSIETREVDIVRNYEVPPVTQMCVTLKVNRQEVVLDCPAMEHVYSKDGKPVLKRLVSGTWRAVSTRFIQADVVETSCLKHPGTKLNGTIRTPAIAHNITSNTSNSTTQHNNNSSHRTVMATSTPVSTQASTSTAGTRSPPSSNDSTSTTTTVSNITAGFPNVSFTSNVPVTPNVPVAASAPVSASTPVNTSAPGTTCTPVITKAPGTTCTVTPVTVYPTNRVSVCTS